MLEHDIITSTGKRGTHGEVIVFLFEKCNLNCMFCTQDHASTIGMNRIQEKFEDVTKSIETQYVFGKRDFSVHLMGGELLADDIPDSILDQYVDLIMNIQAWGKVKGYPIEPTIVTNFVFDNRERVDRLLEQLPDLTLFTSYDPSGRFNKDTLETFKQNVIYYKHKIKAASVVMTKPSMKKFMEGKAEFFGYLYSHFRINFDYYTEITDGVRAKNYVQADALAKLQPTDVDIRDFMKFMLDNYPDCGPWDQYLTSTKKSMTCQDTAYISADGTRGRCVFTYDSEDKYKEVKGKLEEKWFQDYDCLSCKYYDRCSFGCFIANHNTGFRTQEACWLSEVYDHVEQTRSVPKK